MSLALVLAGAARLAAAPSLASVIQPYVNSHRLAGAVTLVANADRVISIETFGWADIALKKPMRPDTVFWIASQTKPFTGAAMMILVDEGKVDLNDPIDKYLPEFKDQWVRGEATEKQIVLKAPQRRIRVRDLLTHTSGMIQQVKWDREGEKVLPAFQKAAAELYGLPKAKKPAAR